MNETVNKLLLVRDNFMPEKHLRHLAFTYSPCGPFTRKKKEYKNFKKQEILDIFIKTN